jgi:histidine ammonia-lyase
VPLSLSGRDGLALIAANGVSVGHAALVADRARRVVVAADLAAALSLDAIAGNPSILAAAVGRAKPIDGQIASLDHLRVLLDGSDLWEPDAARSVQDPLSFRVVPQVHGALREHVVAVTRAVEAELNAAADNPLVSLGDQTLVSNGNFHPIVLAIACDALRVAVAHVGRLSERRMDHLWTGTLQGLTAPPSKAMFGLALRYPAAAAVQELRQLAAPATLDAPSLERGVEDHATGAPLSVRQADRALGLLEDVLAIEVLLARDMLGVAGAVRTLGTGTTALLRTVDRAVADAEPTPDAVHAALRARFPAA